MCPRLISPGRGYFPPPTRDTAEALWWGALKGLEEIRGRPGRKSPARLYILVDSMASVKLISGSIPGRHLASSVFPDPGLPTMSRLCPPAAATSRALRAIYCPRTAERSVKASRRSFSIFSRSTLCLGMSISPLKKPASWFMEETG